MIEPKYFIVIDDDAINNKICRTVIEKIYKDADVNTFTDPILGFEFIVSEYSKPGNNNAAILFLDINMPVMDAWEFLNLFDRLDTGLRNRITIFILSSSVNKVDMERAMSNRNVSYYLIKPLTKESIKLITNLSVRKKQAVTEQQVNNPELDNISADMGETATKQSFPESGIKYSATAGKDEILKAIKLKDELVHREIPDLEKSMNALLFEIETKYRDTGLYVEPITINHSAFDKRKGGKLQLNIHFFEYDKDNIYHIRDGSKLKS